MIKMIGQSVEIWHFGVQFFSYVEESKISTKVQCVKKNEASLFLGAYLMSQCGEFHLIQQFKYF